MDLQALGANRTLRRHPAGQGLRRHHARLPAQTGDLRALPGLRNQRLQRHPDPLRRRHRQAALATQRQHPDLHAPRPVTRTGYRHLKVKLHRPGPELDRIAQTRRLRRAQLTTHRRDRVRQTRQTAISVTHATNTPTRRRL